VSGGTICRCDEKLKPITVRRWHVFQRLCNHSAFNGYRHEYSQYSSVGCAQCGAVWRTKGGYVRVLPDYKDKGALTS
jgi:hypothetical protein